MEELDSITGFDVFAVEVAVLALVGNSDFWLFWRPLLRRLGSIKVALGVGLLL